MQTQARQEEIDQLRENLIEEAEACGMYVVCRYARDAATCVQPFLSSAEDWLYALCVNNNGSACIKALCVRS